MNVNKAKLLDYGMFVVSNHAELRRNELHQWIVEYVLFRSSERLSLEKISVIASNYLELEEPFPTDHLKQGIEDSIQLNHIIEEGNFYYIHPKRLVEIEMENTYYNNLQQNFESYIVSSIISNVHTEVNSNTIKQILSAIEEEIINRFYSISCIATRIHISNGKIPQEETEGQFIQEIIKPILDGDSELLDITKFKILNSIKDALLEIPDNQLEYLNLLLYNIFNNQILKVDPGITEFEQELMINRKIYLDTNVIITYLFTTQNKHELVKRIIDDSKKNGVQFLVFQRTIEELKFNFQRSIKRVKSAQANRRNIESYRYSQDALLKECLSQGTPNWDSIEALYLDTEALLIGYGFNVVDDLCNKDEELYNIVNNELYNLKIENSDYINLDGFLKKIEHDSMFFVSIYNERVNHGTDIIGNKVWGLTLDVSLKNIQRQYNLKEVYNKYLFHTPDEFATIMLAFTNPKTKHNIKSDYVKYLTNSIIKINTNSISTSILDMLNKYQFDLGFINDNMSSHALLVEQVLRVFSEDKEVKKFNQEFGQITLTDDIKREADRLFELKLNKIIEFNINNSYAEKELLGLKQENAITVEEKIILEEKISEIQTQLSNVINEKEESRKENQKINDELKEKEDIIKKQKRISVLIILTILILMLILYFYNS